MTALLYASVFLAPTYLEMATWLLPLLPVAFVVALAIGWTLCDANERRAFNLLADGRVVSSEWVLAEHGQGVLNALGRLERAGLVRSAGVGRHDHQRMYWLTEFGERVVAAQSRGEDEEES